MLLKLSHVSELPGKLVKTELLCLPPETFLEWILAGDQTFLVSSQVIPDAIGLGTTLGEPQL